MIPFLDRDGHFSMKWIFHFFSGLQEYCLTCDYVGSLHMNIGMSRRLYMLCEMCPLPSFNDFVCYRMSANAGKDEILHFRSIIELLI